MTEYKYIENIVMPLNNKASFRFKLKEKDDMRIYTDGEVRFQYGNMDLVCADEPLYYFFQNALLFLQDLIVSAPIDSTRINCVGQLQYVGILSKKKDYQKYYFMSSAEYNCFLYKIGEKSYNIEVVSGSPYDDTPFKLIYHTELTESTIGEWYNLIESIASNVNMFDE